MAETTVVIEGGATNKSFILDLLDQPEVIDGSADTGWIDRVRAEGRLVVPPALGHRPRRGGIEAYEEAEALERARLFETARGGRPQVHHQVGRGVDLKLRGAPTRSWSAHGSAALPRHDLRAAERRRSSTPSSTASTRTQSRIVVGGRNHRLITAPHGPVHLVEVDGVTHRVSRDEGGVLRSPAPALVVATPVEVGAEVAAGAPVLVLESMKMETVLAAPFAARVRELLVGVGSQVETGAPLVRLEPTGDEAEAAEAGAAQGGDATVDLDLPTCDEDDGHVAGPRGRGIGDLSAGVLGFDGDANGGDRSADLLPRRAGRVRRRRPGPARGGDLAPRAASPTSPS